MDDDLAKAIKSIGDNIGLGLLCLGMGIWFAGCAIGMNL